MTINFTSLPICFEVNGEVSNQDDRFIKVTIDVMHTGLNYNRSIFDKSVVEENINTIKNTPILGFIHEVPFEGKDFKGHEYIITRSNGEIKRKYIGSAYGMIPESCNPRWITKMCDDGQEREFLQVDGLLWTKFDDSSEILSKDLEKPHSMELSPTSIDGYEDEDGNFVFTKFSFDGCCILGEDCEPAMQNSNVEVQFTMSDFVKSIQSELNDKFTTFTTLVNEENKNGGIEAMSNTDFAQTVLQQFEDISAMVRNHEVVTDMWGDEVPRYYTVDIQGDEVIVVDRNNGYNYFGLSFTMNGDKAEIDFTSGKRKKICYADYEEDAAPIEGAFEFGGFISEIEEMVTTKIEEANVKVQEAEEKTVEFETAKNELEESYNQVKAEFEEMKPKYEEFVQAEQERIAAELDAQKEAEFAKYETILSDCVEFAELKTKKDEMSVKEIAGECAILYVERSLEQNNFSKSNTGADMTAGIIDNNNNADGFVVTKYGLIPVR